MKLKLLTWLCSLLVITALTSCKKEPGVGGKNSINGTLTFKNGASGTNDAAPMAWVSIAYDANASVSTFNQTILTDINGKYKIEGLQKGSYFLKAGYTDVNGFVYSTAGAIVIFENKKKELEVNFELE